MKKLDINVKQDLDYIIEKALDCLNKNAYKEAFVLLNEAKAERLPYRNLDYYRALCFLYMNQQTAAIEALREELRHFPDNNEAVTLFNELYKEHHDRAWLSETDPEFSEILPIIRPYSMVSDKRLYSLYSLAKIICERNIGGNFVECGVAAGGSAALLAYVIKRHSKQPQFLFAFDSFQGMPQPSEFDSHQGLNATEIGWGTGTCSAPEASVHMLCKKLGVDDVIRVIKGEFRDTLTACRNIVGMISLLHLDGDWYESTLHILNNLYDRIITRGILQVDDYGYWEGCKKAIDEFAYQRKVSFTLQRIDKTGVWFYKPDEFKTNSALAASLCDEFLEDDKAVHGLRSQMSPNERFQLYYAISKLVPQTHVSVRFIEIGSYAGASLITIIKAFQRAGIPFEGFVIEHRGHKSLYAILEEYKNSITHFKMLSTAAVQPVRKIFESDSNYPELIFIDGDHSYDGVANDIAQFFPLLAPGGLIIFHDFLPPLNADNREIILAHHDGKEPGIRRACEDVLEKQNICDVINVPLLYPTDPTQSQAYLPIIPGVFSTMRVYRKKYNM